MHIDLIMHDHLIKTIPTQTTANNNNILLIVCEWWSNVDVILGML